MKQERTKVAKDSRENSDTAAISSAASKDSTVEVLYQKLGSRWYAFSLIDDDVFVGSVPEEKIETEPVKGIYKVFGRS